MAFELLNIYDENKNRLTLTARNYNYIYYIDIYGAESHKAWERYVAENAENEADKEANEIIRDGEYRWNDWSSCWEINGEED